MSHHQDCASCSFTPRNPPIEHPKNRDGLLAVISNIYKERALHQDDVLLQLSDAIITGAACQINPQHNSVAVRGERASQISDQVTWCEQCHDHSVTVGVHASLSLREFAPLLPQIKPHAIAWITVDDTVIEFPN